MLDSIFTENDFLSKIKKVIMWDILDKKFRVSELVHEIGMSNLKLLYKVPKISNIIVSQFVRFLHVQTSMEMLQQTFSIVSINSFNIGFAFVKCNCWRGFNRIKDMVSKHIASATPQKEDSKPYFWVYMMISNAKHNFLKINHQIKNEYNQNFPDVFFYKKNLKYFCSNLFERLLIAAVDDTWCAKFHCENGLSLN